MEKNNFLIFVMGNVGRKKWKFILKLQITEPINITIISVNIWSLLLCIFIPMSQQVKSTPEKFVHLQTLTVSH